ncbi:uncharacterized protein LOC108864951 [Galendromus occidentalis]|uniref:Uncharacterized protein LOC108864951 n=1 Tax=Galendromus occidentalis TaxID=34638 RepID=A0AAJ7L656_9ACAR|nr:uncharacterized protein LOC108864951 [Galendromus occidentalis]
MHAPDSVGIDVRERLDCLGRSAVQKTYAKSTALVAAAVSEMTTKGDPFLLYDSGEGDCERMINFATLDNLELLKTCGEWFLDGTFKVCPVISHQMYSVLVKIPGSHKTVPVVYSLMPGKTSRTYRRSLTILTSVLDDFRPEVTHVDFEIAMVRELETTFPSVGVLGCNFHLNQSLWRHIQADATLRDKYLRENDFSLDVRRYIRILHPDHEADFLIVTNPEAFPHRSFAQDS